MKKVLHFFKNRYLLTVALFVVYNLFINNIDIPFIISSRWELHKLREQALQLEKDNIQAKQQLEAINAKNFALEKLAREEYFMKKPNEDVYVFKIKN
jgi:cell division protein DivIC